MASCVQTIYYWHIVAGLLSMCRLCLIKAHFIQNMNYAMQNKGKNVREAPWLPAELPCFRVGWRMLNISSDIGHAHEVVTTSQSWHYQFTSDTSVQPHKHFNDPDVRILQPVPAWYNWKGFYKCLSETLKLHTSFPNFESGCYFPIHTMMLFK